MEKSREVLQIVLCLCIRFIFLALKMFFFSQKKSVILYLVMTNDDYSGQHQITLGESDT